MTFNELDFGKKAPKTVTFNYTAAADATVEVKAGKATVEFTLPAAAQWTEVSFDMPAKVKGLQDLSVALCNDAAVEIDWVTFK